MRRCWRCHSGAFSRPSKSTAAHAGNHGQCFTPRCITPKPRKWSPKEREVRLGKHEPDDAAGIATSAQAVPEGFACARYFSGSVKNSRSKSACTGLSVSDLKSGSLAGYFRLIRSNLCTRHIQKKLTPRGHHDWPDKGDNSSRWITRQRPEDVTSARGPFGPDKMKYVGFRTDSHPGHNRGVCHEASKRRNTRLRALQYSLQALTSPAGGVGCDQLGMELL